jgi:hypothetical protein
MEIKSELSQARPPNFISALLAGFDSISNHLALLLLPILLDLFLWLGPKLKIEQLLKSTFNDLSQVTTAGSVESESILQATQDFWEIVAGRMNLFFSLRSYPVGIPSLMTSTQPVDAPVQSFGWELNTWAMVILVWIVFGIIGLMVGTLYFQAIAHVALDGRLDWKSLWSKYPRSFGQVFILTITCMLFLILISIPASFLLSLIVSVGSLFGQILILIIGSFFIWLLFPVIYSVHGIFAYQLRFTTSVRKSIQIVQMTLPVTALFFLALVVIDQGLGLLWQIPDTQSWFSLIGVFGHAFVTTALLAASFIYYRDADHWIQSILNRVSKSENI